MARLLGYGPSQLPVVAQWTARFVACLSPLSNPQQVASAHGAAERLLASLRDLRPGAAVSGAWSDEAAMLSNLLGLLSQTYEATAGLLGNCIVAIQRGVEMTDPAQLVALTVQRDPAIHNTRRFAATDVVLGSVTVRAGQAMLLVLASDGGANGFGHGRHACPGQVLARQIVAQALHALMSSCVLAPLAWRYRPSLNARIPEFLEPS
jgi:cytochrome P450